MNSERYLEQCLQSIMDQGHPETELLFFDGGSTDKTVEIIKRYKKYIYFWESCRDEGQFHAFNKGIMRATGEILTLMGSDDYYKPGAFAAVCEAFERYTNAALIYGEVETIDLENNLIHMYGARQAIHHEIATIKCFIPCQAAFFKRNVVASVGLLSTNYTWSSDWEYWLRITKKFEYRFIDRVLACWRINPNNTTYRIRKGYYKRYLETIEVSYKYGRTIFSPLIVMNIQGLIQYPLYRNEKLRREVKKVLAKLRKSP